MRRARRGTVVVIGDSIPRGYKVGPHEDYPSQLVRHELRPGYEVVNLAVPGSYGPQTGFDLRPDHPPAVAALVQTGLNGILLHGTYNDPDQNDVHDMLVATVDALRAVGVELVFVAKIPPFGVAGDQGLRTAINTLIDGDQCGATAVWDPADDAYLANPANAVDLVHWDAEGHRRAAALVAAVMRPFLYGAA